MTRVVCAPKDARNQPAGDIRYFLYGRSSSPGVGAVGARLPEEIRTLGLAPTPRAWDFLSISLAVIAADEGCSRANSPDGWTRRIALTVAVADPTFWSSQTATLEAALRFLTGDIWTLSFTEDGFSPAPPKHAKARPETVVSLLSGGMDSLIGAIDLVADGHLPLLVSQVAKGDKKEQVRFAKAIAPNALHVQLNHKAAHPKASERSQRGRSLVFFGFGVLAASCLTPPAPGVPAELVVPENGYISLNPPLTPLRIGSLSTRTTHPYYLARVQEVLDAAGLKVQLRNPYQHRTKGEMLAGCKNPHLLAKLVGQSTSCGRYARTAFTQCGRCVPCLVRRSAFHAANHNDPTRRYKYDALGTPGKAHREFDDVRAVGFAAHHVRTHGLDAWLGGALNSALLGDISLYRDVTKRGLAELEQFLQAQGAL